MVVRGVANADTPDRYRSTAPFMTVFVLHHDVWCPDCGRPRYYQTNEGRWVCVYCDLTKMCECRRKLVSQPHQCFYTMLSRLSSTGRASDS